MLNKVQIIGRLGQDPEVRHMPSGDAVCNFSLATSEKWKDKASGEQREATEWHRISAFGRVAEIIGEYVRKGSLIYVEGKLQTRKYIDKDGAERTSTEIRLEEMKMLGSAEGGGRQATNGPGTAPSAAPRTTAPAAAPRAPLPRPTTGGSGFDDMDDDIPF